MTLYVLRHARAGRRSAWRADDQLRPLTKVGRRQANGVAGVLEGRAVTRIVSSPYVRCIQSVEPLAHQLGLRVETADALAEGTPLDDVLRLVEKVADQETVLCTHGDVLKLLLEHVRGAGVKVRRRNGVPLMEKGSVWELATDHGAIVSATYHKPPLPTGR